MRSQAVEDYLKTIFFLQSDEEPVGTTQIARRLDVAAASASGMVKRLAELQLVEYQSYRGVTLTEKGRKVAMEIIRHHRLLALYLKEVMGFSWASVHREAEHLEHHISEEFESKLDEILGYPTHDPHGDPIPTREGRLADRATHPLSDVEIGRKVVVQRVSDKDPDLLGYLESISLLPGTCVEVLGQGTTEGPLTVRIDGYQRQIAHFVATRVFVDEDEEAAG